MIHKFTEKLNSIGIPTRATEVTQLPLLGQYDFIIYFTRAELSGAFLLGKVKDNLLTLYRGICNSDEEITLKEPLDILMQNEVFLQNLQSQYNEYISKFYK